MDNLSEKEITELSIRLGKGIGKSGQSLDTVIKILENVITSTGIDTKQKYKYDKFMDKDCIELCNVFNDIGLTTKFSCSGHLLKPFHIIFSAKQTDDLLPLMEIIERKKYINKFQVKVLLSYNFTHYEVLYKFESITKATPEILELITELTKDLKIKDNNNEKVY